MKNLVFFCFFFYFLGFVGFILSCLISVFVVWVLNKCRYFGVRLRLWRIGFISSIWNFLKKSDKVLSGGVTIFVLGLVFESRCEQVGF